MLKSNGLLVAGSILALITSTQALAQDSTDDEIIVTATKRAESIFDVPVPVTAVSGEQLEKANIRDISDLQNVAPALTFSQSTGGLQSVFAIRGIGTAGNNTGLEQSVGVIIDGVYRGRPGSALNDYVDINQIEVLRGPQGTIFGKNTSAGVINVRTSKPSTDGFRLKADLSAGNYGFKQLRGSMSGPVSDNVAMGVSVAFQNRDGFIDNLADGSTLNNRNRWSIRGQLLWEPTEDVSLRIIADKSEADENCCVAVPVLYGPATAAIRALGANVVPSTEGTLGGYPGSIVNMDNREVYVTPAQPFEDPLDDSGVSAELEWNLGGVTATAIAAYRTFESIPNIDADFTQADIFDSVIGQDLTEKSLELRLASNGDQMVDWLIGAYYFDQDIYAQNYLGFGPNTRGYVNLVTPPGVIGQLEGLTGADAGTFFADGVVSEDNYDYNSESYAFFGNATWHVNDRLDLTAGLRYTDEDKYADYQINSTGAFSQLNLGAINPAFAGLATLQTAPAVDPFDANFSDSNLSFAVSASYEVSDNLNLYGRFSQGYKSGGFNLNRNGPNTAPGTPDRVANYDTLVAMNANLTPVQSLRDAVTFQPEEVDAYELGFKSRMFDRNLKLDANLFYQTLENFQANSFNGTVFTIRNAGELEGRGLEIDYSWQLMDNLSWTGGATLQDIEYKTFIGASATAAQNAAGMATQDLSGEKPNFVSDVIVSGSFDYTQAMSNGYEGVARLGYRYRSDYTTGQDNDAITLQESYITLDASLGFQADDGRWGLDVWAKNLTDETIANIVFDTPLQAGSFSAFLEAPRTYGATLRYNFD